MNQTSKTIYQAYIFVATGVACLMLVHAMGRFAFTPLLPYLIQDHIITLTQGANLATGNYVGYLVGALAAIYFNQPKKIKQYIVFGLICNFAVTVTQCFVKDYDLLLALRLLNGISNGFVFVLAPALVLEWLSEHALSRLSGLVYLGIGVGLIFSGMLVDWTSTIFFGAWRWIPIAIACVPLFLLSVWQIPKIKIHPVAQSNKTSNALLNAHTTPLFLAYLGAGLGYILPMTFLPVLAHDVGENHVLLVKNIWLITALCCAVFIPIWNSLGTKFGDQSILFISYWVQAIGVVCVMVFPNIFGVLGCAIFVGGSFMASVLCTQRLARFFQPHQGAKLSAAMITIYAGAQLFGPWLAKWWIESGGTLLQSFAMGFIAFVWSIFWTWRMPKK
ncbi:MAG: YbfB/YjiJ family MFS transporter [Acinetobacter sp.]